MGGTVSAFMRRLHARRRTHGLTWCERASRAASTARAPASPWSRSSRCTNRRSDSWWVRCCNETFAEKEEPGQRLPLSVVVLDELNKYAPREGHSPLKEMLVDIAQRGRSLGVLLVGAQQTASRVAGRCSRTPRSG